MAENKRTAGDFGQGEVQRRVDEAEQKGYLGVSPDPHPDEAYSLKSGPESPSAADSIYARLDQHSSAPVEQKEGRKDA